jgi:hypothetical protein
MRQVEPRGEPAASSETLVVASSGILAVAEEGSSYALVSRSSKGGRIVSFERGLPCRWILCAQSLPQRKSNRRCKTSFGGQAISSLLPA